jgi:hypothetical protein
MSKKCRPLFKKHESNKSFSLIIVRTIDERNRTRPPQTRQFIAQAARLKLPGGLCVSIEPPHRAEGLLLARP